MLAIPNLQRITQKEIHREPQGTPKAGKVVKTCSIRNLNLFNLRSATLRRWRFWAVQSRMSACLDFFTVSFSEVSGHILNKSVAFVSHCTVPHLWCRRLTCLQMSGRIRFCMCMFWRLSLCTSPSHNHNTPLVCGCNG